MNIIHTPVLLQQAVECLNCRKGMTYVDCTIGPGGHSKAIGAKIYPGGRIVGIDRDKEALSTAIDKLEEYQDIFSFVQGNFKNLISILKTFKISKVDGILFDLGLSSLQIEDDKRGFSFLREGPLDMRMDRDQRESAFIIINKSPEKELGKIIREFGEERFWKRIAAAIVARRKEKEVTTTTELAEIIKEAIPAKYRPRKIHPATKAFQAIRIAVNSELDNLRAALPQAIQALNPTGRLVVISYHSLEDGIVKKAFKNFEKGCICPPDFPVCKCGKVSQVRVITKKPIRPSEEEIKKNPRGRSARMRVCEKII